MSRIPGPLERLQRALFVAEYFGGIVAMRLRDGIEPFYRDIDLAHQAATEAQWILNEAVSGAIAEAAQEAIEVEAAAEARGIISRPDLYINFEEAYGGYAHAGAFIAKGAHMTETFTCEACGKVLEATAGALPPAWVIVEDQATGARSVFCSRETAATVDRVLESRGQALAAVRRGRVQEG